MADSESLPSSYLLKRDRAEATKLGAQHLLWKMHMNYILHPSIQIKDNMVIADIGAGTGIWAIEVAMQLPSARVMASDISDNYFPLPQYRPSNVSFDHLDILGDIPSSLVGQFDVVHLRALVYITRDNNPRTLIQNATKLLKPGGYIQWEECRIENAIVKGDATVQIREILREMSVVTKAEFQWAEEVDQHVNREDNLEVVECQYRPWSKELIPLCTDSFFMGLENAGAVLDRLRLIEPSLRSCDDWMKTLDDAWKETRNGDQLFWLPVTLLARKTA